MDGWFLDVVGCASDPRPVAGKRLTMLFDVQRIAQIERAIIDPRIGHEHTELAVASPGLMPDIEYLTETDFKTIDRNRMSHLASKYRSTSSELRFPSGVFIW